MIDLKGKVAVVFGLANKRSIAYSVAQKLAEAGATIVLSYQSERLQREAEELLADLGQNGIGRIFQCDVSRDDQIDALFANIAAAFPIPKIDILIAGDVALEGAASGGLAEIVEEFLGLALEAFGLVGEDEGGSGLGQFLGYAVGNAAFVREAEDDGHFSLQINHSVPRKCGESLGYQWMEEKRCAGG